jgi:hypothetical protein
MASLTVKQSKPRSNNPRLDQAEPQLLPALDSLLLDIERQINSVKHIQQACTNVMLHALKK